MSSRVVAPLFVSDNPQIIQYGVPVRKAMDITGATCTARGMYYRCDRFREQHATALTVIRENQREQESRRGQPGQPDALSKVVTPRACKQSKRQRIDAKGEGKSTTADNPHVGFIIDKSRLFH